MLPPWALEPLLRLSTIWEVRGPFPSQLHGGPGLLESSLELAFIFPVGCSGEQWQGQTEATSQAQTQAGAQAQAQAKQG